MITGTLANYSREAAKKMVEDAGGKSFQRGEQEDRLCHRRRRSRLQAGQGARTGVQVIDEKEMEQLAKAK